MADTVMLFGLLGWDQMADGPNDCANIFRRAAADK